MAGIGSSNAGEVRTATGTGVLYVLDTCILVDHLRGYPEAREWLGNAIRQSQALDLACSVITLAELISGLPRTSCQSQEAVENLLSLMKVVPVGEDIAHRAGAYVREWGASHGVGIADALVAATARHLGVPLVTIDKRHFPMDDLEVVVPY
ncbi:MAG: type II toxin-antitoxin system VapC family toxin [Bacillota bacterium]|nr:type II toxin-antitoxin system VapC family toxin [Bacillota bacterium]